MAQAVRSPGSTLKPFIYGLGFEDGFIHPETLIEDRPVSYGAYAPKDFDFGFKGTVSVREALQFSLNVPAVAVLDRVGPVRLAARLTQAGAALTLPDGQAPGLAHGAWRRRHQARRSGEALCRHCAARFGRAAERAHGRRRAGSAPPDGAGRRLVCQQCACSARRRRKTALPAASPSRPAPATAIATPGRSASTASTRSASGSAGLTARRCRASSAARPRRRSCSMPSRASAVRPLLCRAHRPAWCSLPMPSCRRRCGTFSRDDWPARRRSRRSASCFRPTARALDLTQTDGKPDPVALKVTGAVAPLTVLVNGVPVPGAGRGGGKCAVLQSGGARLLPRHRDRRLGRCRQRRRAGGRQRPRLR